MRERGLAIAWVVVGVVFLVLLAWEVSKARSLLTERARAAAEGQRLTEQIRLKEAQLVAEMRVNAAMLQEMQWTSAGGDPAAFLTRLAGLAQEKRMKVLGIGPLERQAVPQFNKSWHAIQIVAPYREIRELAGRIESEKGILEDVRLDLPGQPARPAGGPSPADEVQARFKITALELSPEAKKILERALAASGGQAAAGSLGLPVPATRVADASPLGRDPFYFIAPPPPTVVAGRRPTEPPAPPRPLAPMELKGIVGFPGGFLAILNDQIVKVGDMVAGSQVERITQDAVVVREPGGAPRTVVLPEIVPLARPGR